jgi:hypothetical protein
MASLTSPDQAKMQEGKSERAFELIKFRTQFTSAEHAWEKAECISVEGEKYAPLGEAKDCNDNSPTNKRAIGFILSIAFCRGDEEFPINES